MVSVRSDSPRDRADLLGGTPADSPGQSAQIDWDYKGENRTVSAAGARVKSGIPRCIEGDHTQGCGFGEYLAREDGRGSVEGGGMTL